MPIITQGASPETINNNAQDQADPSTS